MLRPQQPSTNTLWKTKKRRRRKLKREKRKKKSKDDSDDKEEESEREREGEDNVKIKKKIKGWKNIHLPFQWLGIYLKVLSMKFRVFSRVQIWPTFVFKDKFLRSDSFSFPARHYSRVGSFAFLFAPKRGLRIAFRQCF